MRPLYKRLKKELPPRRIGSFIEAAVRARMASDPKALDAACKAADCEHRRRRLTADWSRAETEGYDVTPDGQRFLINAAVRKQESPPITLVLNWKAKLKR